MINRTIETKVLSELGNKKAITIMGLDKSGNRPSWKRYSRIRIRHFG